MAYYIFSMLLQRTSPIFLKRSLKKVYGYQCASNIFLRYGVKEPFFLIPNQQNEERKTVMCSRRGSTSEKGIVAPCGDAHPDCPFAMPQQPVFKYGTKVFLCRVVTVPTRQSIMVFTSQQPLPWMTQAEEKWLAHRPNALGDKARVIYSMTCKWVVNPLL
ncbi:MAG: hypothetical protein R2795_20635 [Saprospiraceae bacterium]